jgi:dienelactone hydrolase
VRGGFLFRRRSLGGAPKIEYRGREQSVLPCGTQAALPMVLGLDLDLVARSAVGLSIAATAFRGGAAFAVIDQPRMPTLSGAFEHVGVRYETCGGARVKVFYPAAAPSDVAAPYCTDGRDTSDGMAGLVGFRQTGLSFLLSHLSDAQSGCWLDAPPAEAEQRPPVLVYSHGFGGNMDMASYMFRTFAAHGIIVAAVEHTDGTASFTKLVDEAPRPFAPRMLSRKEQLSKRAAELIAAAQPGALGLPDSLDGGDLFFGGHSYGGPAALLAASSASAASPSLPLRGVLLHDPALGMGEDVWAIRRAASRPDVPTLSFVSDEYDKYGVRCGEATLHTIGGFHGNFVDAYAPWEDTNARCHVPQSDAVALTLAALQCVCASRVLTGRYGHPSGSWPRFPCCYRRRARAIRS